MPTLLRIAGMAGEKRERKVSQIDAQLGKEKGEKPESLQSVLPLENGTLALYG
jgi:hypothetical protein